VQEFIFLRTPPTSRETYDKLAAQGRLEEYTLHIKQTLNGRHVTGPFNVCLCRIFTLLSLCSLCSFHSLFLSFSLYSFADSFGLQSLAFNMHFLSAPP
jgi:hypothetical protein